MAVDDAGHQRQPIGIDHSSGRFRKTMTGRSYLSVLNRDVFESGVSSCTVKDESVPDEKIKHALQISDQVPMRFDQVRPPYRVLRKWLKTISVTMLSSPAAAREGLEVRAEALLIVSHLRKAQ